jgi:thioredoxin 1
MKFLKIILSLLLLTGIIYAFTPERVSIKQEDGMTVEEYVKKTENKDKIVFVYFKADWCAPCIKLKPAIEQLQTEEKEKVDILVIDVDENKKVATHFEINTLPLFIIYKNGKKVWENNTSLPKAEIQKKLNLYK